MTPMLHTSTALPYGFWANTSGAAQIVNQYHHHRRHHARLFFFALWIFHFAPIYDTRTHIFLSRMISLYWLRELDSNQTRSRAFFFSEARSRNYFEWIFFYSEFVIRILTTHECMTLVNEFYTHKSNTKMYYSTN